MQIQASFLLYTLTLLVYQFHIIFTFDLISSLQGKLLPDLSKLISPELLSRILPRGINATTIESLRNDPAQIQRILAKLKPMQGRFDPHLFEVLSNTFNLPPLPISHPQHPSRRRQRPIEVKGHSVNTHSRIPPHQANYEPRPEEGLHPQQSGAEPQYIEASTSTSTASIPTSSRITTPAYSIPAKVSRHDPNRFSSTYVKRRRYKGSNKPEIESDIKGLVQTTPMAALEEDAANNKTEAPAPFNHITDPNIKNHRLFIANTTVSPVNNKNKKREYKRFENYTIIDQMEDLMMDESVIPEDEYSPKVSIIPLSSFEAEVNPSTNNNKNPGNGNIHAQVNYGGWIPSKPELKQQRPNRRPGGGPSYEDSSIETHPRAPLLNNERTQLHPVGEHAFGGSGQDHEYEGAAEGSHINFRPSQDDTLLSSLEFVKPDQDFFTSTIRSSEEHNNVIAISTSKKPFVMPEFPNNKHKKTYQSQSQSQQQSTKNVQKLNYDQNFLNRFMHRNGVPPPASGTNSNGPYPSSTMPYHPGLHSYRPNPIPPPPPLHPQMSHLPSHLLHKKQLYYGNGNAGYFHPSPNQLEQTAENILAQAAANSPAADDKNDSTSWSSTFFLLGGLVAASALAAFILPSFLTTVTAAGKDNDDNNGLDATNNNNDFWNDVKGLYNDLRHIAKGDMTYFEKEHMQLKKSKTTHAPMTSTTTVPFQGSSFEMISQEEPTSLIVNDNNKLNEFEEPSQTTEWTFDDEDDTLHESEDNMAVSFIRIPKIEAEREDAEEEEEENSTSAINTSSSSSSSDSAGESEDIEHEQNTRRSNRRHDDKEEILPIENNKHKQHDENPFNLIKSNNGTFFINNTEFSMNNLPGKYFGANSNNSSFLKEWAKVQLQLLDN